MMLTKLVLILLASSHVHASDGAVKLSTIRITGIEANIQKKVEAMVEEFRKNESHKEQGGATTREIVVERLSVSSDATTSTLTTEIQMLVELISAGGMYVHRISISAAYYVQYDKVSKTFIVTNPLCELYNRQVDFRPGPWCFLVGLISISFCGAATGISILIENKIDEILNKAPRNKLCVSATEHLNDVFKKLSKFKEKLDFGKMYLILNLTEPKLEMTTNKWIINYKTKVGADLNNQEKQNSLSRFMSANEDRAAGETFHGCYSSDVDYKNDNSEIIVDDCTSCISVCIPPYPLKKALQGYIRLGYMEYKSIVLVHALDQNSQVVLENNEVLTDEQIPVTEFRIEGNVVWPRDGSDDPYNSTATQIIDVCHAELMPGGKQFKLMVMYTFQYPPDNERKRAPNEEEMKKYNASIYESLLKPLEQLCKFDRVTHTCEIPAPMIQAPDAINITWTRAAMISHSMASPQKMLCFKADYTLNMDL